LKQVKADAGTAASARTAAPAAASPRASIGRSSPYRSWKRLRLATPYTPTWKVRNSPALALRRSAVLSPPRAHDAGSWSSMRTALVRGSRKTRAPPLLPAAGAASSAARSSGVATSSMGESAWKSEGP
jgi:hypothetical protein